MLAAQLNKYGVNYTSSRDGVKLEVCPEDDSLFDNEGLVIDDDFSKFLYHVDTFKAYADSHPVDDRAGLVCFVQSGKESAWYDETSECCWLS